jgi:hypothetical protein
MLVGLIGVFSAIWSESPHAWRWAIVALFAYTAITTPIVIIQTLRTYWNAGAAANENRRLLGIAGTGLPGGNALP